MTEIVKSEVTADDLILINEYSKSPLKAEDIYTFKAVCCDNQIDRDFEKFSDNALEKMAELYVGKTVIKDHCPNSDNQIARIYRTAVEDDGRGLKRLVASIYVPVTDETKDFISDIETGIRKEVSVSCAVGKNICSVCGKDFYSCGHCKSREYDGKYCYVTLDDVSDVYELSFVAVPAQKGAGVIKSFKFVQKRQSESEETNNALQVRLRLARADNFIFESEEIDYESK